MSSSEAQRTRPKALHTSRSFTRMESPSSPSSPRKRASTIQMPGISAVPEARHIDTSPEADKNKQKDVFENRDDENDGAEEAPEPSSTASPIPEVQPPGKLDELPIEIRSLTERFLESLSAKVHPAPLSADVLSDMFQDFYERAASHIATHIATLAARIGRKSDKSPSPSVRSGKGRTRAGSGAKRGDSPASSTGGEMLTASEVADRKKARKLLELKRVALEEAVERAVCEKLYDKIWKHRSTDDDARDEKLRSRTAALSVVGIGLKELHMDPDPLKEHLDKTPEERQAEISDSLSAAREALRRMDDEQYPLGKLQHLTAAHKSIVETLSELFPSSSSADEILPTLIYTLVTSPPEGINVVSNLNFIQRFRAASKVDGEAAYCLVNLEAAISFLETVDLSSLRADELPEGPPKSNSRPSTPQTEKIFLTPQPTKDIPLKPEVFTISATSNETATPDSSQKSLPPTAPAATLTNRPGLQTRRLSSMVQAQADRFEASRDNFLQTADKVYDSINNTLDSSLGSLLNRFKAQAPTTSPHLPKTLAEARQLVSSPSATTPEEEYPPNLSLLGAQSSPLTGQVDDPLAQKPASNSALDQSPRETKMLDLLGGRRTTPASSLRDRSADSTASHRSTTSANSKRTATNPLPISTTTSNTPPSISTDPSTAQTSTSTPAQNFMNNLNPLNRLGVSVGGAMPSFARFGRSASASQPSAAQNQAQPSPPSSSNEKLQQQQQPKAAKGLEDIVESPAAMTPAKGASIASALVGGGSEAGDDLNAIETLAELRKIKPPRKRFLEVEGAEELKIGEVEELLAEYRRLAKAIAEAIAL